MEEVLINLSKSILSVLDQYVNSSFNALANVVCRGNNECLSFLRKFENNKPEKAKDFMKAILLIRFILQAIEDDQQRIYFMLCMLQILNSLFEEMIRDAVHDKNERRKLLRPVIELNNILLANIIGEE